MLARPPAPARQEIDQRDEGNIDDRRDGNDREALTRVTSGSARYLQVEREPTGEIVARTGAAYALVWLIVIGGRIIFAEAATHTSFGQTVASFSRSESITGNGAWRAMFVLMALAMVLTRVVVLGLRTAQLRLSGPSSFQR